MIRRLAAFGIVLALAACSKMPGVKPPPARFDHGPLPAGLRYLYVPAAQVGETCRSYGDKAEAANILACYVPLFRLIVLPTQGSDPLIFAALKRHEEAHARGWPANHPD